MSDRTYFPLEDLRELMDIDFVNKKKINCIKHLRAMTGEGLKETKDFFEQEWLPFINGERKSYAPQPFNFDQDEILRRLTALEEKVQFLSTAQTRATAKGLFDEPIQN